MMPIMTKFVQRVETTQFSLNKVFIKNFKKRFGKIFLGFFLAFDLFMFFLGFDERISVCYIGRDDFFSGLLRLKFTVCGLLFGFFLRPVLFFTRKANTTHYRTEKAERSRKT